MLYSKRPSTIDMLDGHFRKRKEPKLRETDKDTFAIVKGGKMN